MVRKLEKLFDEKSPKWLLPKGHTPTIANISWGEPPTYQSTCTCGWEGLLVSTWEPAALRRDLLPVVERYGREGVLGLREIYGDRLTAVRLVLEHIHYSPAQQELQAQDALTRALGKLRLSQPDALEELQKLASTVEKACERMLLAKLLKVFMATHALPQTPSIDPEARAAYRAVMAAPETAKRIPEDDGDVPEVLRSLGVSEALLK